MVLPRACRKTGSSASVTKFCRPTKSPPPIRALWSERTNACTTGTSVKTTNNAKVGRTKRYDHAWRRSAAPIVTAACARRTREADERSMAARLFVRFVQQLLRGRRYLIECLLRRLLALEGRITRRTKVLLVDLGPGAHVRQHIRERAHLRDLRLRGVVFAVDTGSRGARGGREPVLDRRSHLLQVGTDVGTGEVLREDVRRRLLVRVRLLAYGDEADPAPSGLRRLALREVRDVPVRA